MSIIVFSLNVWNLNENYKSRMKTLDDYLIDLRPDIVCLQEISVDPESGRPQTSELSKYSLCSSQLYSSQGKWGEREEGLATFSKLPIIAFNSFMLPDAPEDMQRRVQLLVAECCGKRLLIANTHLAYHLHREGDRVRQCEVIEAHLRRAAIQYDTAGIILAGDLNTLPDSQSLDVFKNSSLGLIEIFEKSAERETSFSFPKESPYMDEALWPDRWIDYIFASSSISVRDKRLALNGGQNGAFVSDHAALEATFELCE